MCGIAKYQIATCGVEYTYSKEFYVGIEIYSLVLSAR